MKRLALLALVIGGALLPGCEAQLRTEPVYATTAQPPPRPTRERATTSWVTLADTYSADTERQFINVLGRGGDFRKIRVEAVRGAPVITKVAIEYMDRDTQVVDLSSRLPRGEGHVIDLNGRGQPINRIVVYSDPRYGGSYSVFGT